MPVPTHLGQVSYRQHEQTLQYPEDFFRATSLASELTLNSGQLLKGEAHCDLMVSGEALAPRGLPAALVGL